MHAVPEPTDQSRPRQDESMLAALVRNLPGVAYRRCNDAEWTMEFASAGCLELTGYPAADFIENRARTWSSIIVPTR